MTFIADKIREATLNNKVHSLVAKGLASPRGLCNSSFATSQDVKFCWLDYGHVGPHANGTANWSTPWPSNDAQDEDITADGLDVHPVVRCTRCQLTQQEHGKGNCRTFTPRQPTLAQVLDYLGMKQDLERFRHWVHLSLEPWPLADRLRDLFGAYLQDFGEHGFNRETFIDWVVCTIIEDTRVDDFYRNRLAARAFKEGSNDGKKTDES